MHGQILTAVGGGVVQVQLMFTDLRAWKVVNISKTLAV